VVFVFVVGDIAMLVTGVTDGAMVVFVFVVDDMPMRVTGVTDGIMVVFLFVVGDVLMLLTGVTDGAIADVPNLVNGGAMAVAEPEQQPCVVNLMLCSQIHELL
jgi:hypothetical protein